MPTFAYTVKDKQGRTHTGTLETESRKALMEQLWKQEFLVLSIQERQRKRLGAGVMEPRVPTNQLVIFARQLATLVASGIPILGALEILAQQMDDKAFRRVLERVNGDVEGGANLSESIGKHPKIFSEFFVNMVRAGESSGRLDEILDRLAVYLEKAEGLKRKISSSLFYPALVTVLSVLITIFLVVVIVPKFREIFTSLGGQLPLPTQILLWISDFMRHYIAVEIVGVITTITALQFALRTKQGRFWWDGVRLKMPILGKLFQKAAIARFSRTLSTLVRSGVPILTALDIVAKTSGNSRVEAVVLKARASIQQGEALATPLSNSGVFPPMVSRMIAVGEKTGELEKMLTKIADFYESEVDAAVTGLTSIIEPLIIAMLGIVIGAIVIALFLPIFKISQLVAH